MCERLKVDEIGEIGFIIGPIVRHNLYKTPQIFNSWDGAEFETILKCVKSHLRPSTRSVTSRQSNYVESHDRSIKSATQKGREAEDNEVAKSARKPLNVFLEENTNCNIKYIRNQCVCVIWGGDSLK